ncbi:cell division protein PerM [Microbacterium stercoris]|uniref:Uncharacterized protein n=1 Tax=Microbacterium stercoris TaxID=2820289 RepID=A0A939QIM5_9MICO|nr:DUF6350 family protein [Microbacterium stercoris]MBO3663604.1 hypothetical protein [Microbacterium stercoris]
MHRLVVALLAALDAAVSAIVGWAAALVPLMLMWVFAFGGLADWSALWPATIRIWQLGNLVPLAVALDDTFLLDMGLPPEAAAFGLSLAPLAFAVLIAVFAARSGRRAVQSGRWFTGWAAGTFTTALAAVIALLTSANPVASVAPWQAILFPTLVYGLPMLLGAVTGAWIHGDGGLVDRLHDIADRFPAGWREFPALILRGGGMALAGVVAFAAATIAIAVPFRGTHVIALYESAGADLTGTVLITLAQFAYLPTLIGWAVSWIAGPGFALGAGTGVTPAGTQLGVLPGLPVLGLIPENGSPFLLLAVLAPVVAGALAGWGIRIAFRAEAQAEGSDHEPAVPRVMLAVGIAVVAGAGGALIAVFTSGSFGPGRLAVVGPEPGAIAVALGLEVLVGAAILLLAPRRYERRLQEFMRGDDLDLDVDADAEPGGTEAVLPGRAAERHRAASVD